MNESIISLTSIKDKCINFNANDLIYQSSEEYLIVCLKLCNHIIKDKCSIEQLINFNITLTPEPLLLSHLNSTECHKYSHKESHKMALFVLGAILCFTILTLNSLTLITILKSSRLHSLQNIFIANLSVSDFLSGISFMYPCILNLLTIYALETYNPSLYKLACMIRQYYYLCLAGYSPMITSMLSSMFTLTLLALEKYIAILHPYFYERLVNEHQLWCYLCLILGWMVSIVVSLLPLMGWNEITNKSNFVPCMFEKIFTLDYILLFTSICCICALAMLGIYLRIYFIARKHSKQIAKIQSILSTNQISTKTNKAFNKNIKNFVNNYNSSICNNDRISKQFSLINDDEYEMENLNLKNRKHNKENSITNSNKVRSHSSSNMSYNNLTINDKKSELIDSIISEENHESYINKSVKSSVNFGHIDYDEDEGKKDFKEEISSSNDILTATRTPMQISTPPPMLNPSHSSTHSNSLNMNIKAMKTLLILLLGFYICWLPLIIYFLTFASKKYENLTIHILMFFACCNAVIDPIVYAFRNKDFLRALLENFKRSSTSSSINLSNRT